MKKTINMYEQVDSIPSLVGFINSVSDHCKDGEDIVEIKVVRKMDREHPDKIGVGFGVQITTILDCD